LIEHKIKEFQNILDEFQSDLKKIDNIISEFAAGKSSLIFKISHHLISSGGKRIRPILLILSAKLCGTKTGDDHYNLAAAVELIHTATLLHDDVVDRSEIRRGKKTAHAIWDNKASILVGDYLFASAFQLMVRSRNLSALDLLAKTSSIMADGEVMQLENSNDVTLCKEKYLEIIFSKTAILFSTACESGAIINNRSQEENFSLRNFGKNLGIIFQIIDDILDYCAQEKSLGKDIGNDFFEAKVTLPIILTYEKASFSEKKFISEAFARNLFTQDRNQDNFDKILELIKKCNAIEAAKNMALNCRCLALKSLEVFPDSCFKQDLTTILDYCLARIS
jgi:octaprenyl-diphosphate synthase